MILSRRVALNGVQLDSLDPRILIQGVQIGTAKRSVRTADRMMGVGQRITGDHWQTLETVVTWALDIRRKDMAARRTVWERVAEWASAGGWLTFSGTPGRQMYAELCEIETPGDWWEWNKDFKITFRAYNVPFWQGNMGSAILYPTLSSGVYTGSMWINPEGHVDTVLDISYENLSGSSMSNFLVAVEGGGRLNLSGVNLAAGETLTITHGTDGILRITATGDGQGNILRCLQTDSTDDLYLPVGAHLAGFSATRYGRATLNWRGRWL